MKVLIVEDEAAVADALRTGLRAEGFTVALADNGVDGLWMAREQDVDVIVLDLMLPGLSGYEVCRRLRRTDVHVPVLMLTAKDGEYDEADALDLGADDFLSKPFSFVVLLARIRALLRRAPAERPPVLVAGALTLDPAAHECRLDEELVELTAREFALAEFLLRRQGRLVSRSTIAEHVWDGDLSPGSNVVDVYIGYLRRKWTGHPGAPTIETVRGAGYRLMVRTRALRDG